MCQIKSSNVETMTHLSIIFPDLGRVLVSDSTPERVWRIKRRLVEADMKEIDWLSARFLR